MRGLRILGRLGLWALAACAAGCASTQEIRIRCVPERVELYVDGRLLEDPAAAVVLPTDEPHKIYAKGPGYEPRLVVLEPAADAEGRTRLGPDDVCIELVPIGVGRKLEIDVEGDAPAGTP